MTTSITDARFTHLHATQDAITALLTDPSTEEDPDPWSVMPGYDQDLPVPAHLDPPRPDHDDTLPSQLHPSYPYGRPGQRAAGSRAKGVLHTAKGPRAQVTNLLSAGQRHESWHELNLGALLRNAGGREVPPVMAGAKRPPSPPSPQLFPHIRHDSRSAHVDPLLRGDVTTDAPPTDLFDAPVPNETYADEDIEAQQQGRWTPEAGAGAGNVQEERGEYERSRRARRGAL